jgi:hypothetical protein
VNVVPHLVGPLGRKIALALPTTVFGRAPDCQVVIADRRASRRHAEISRLEAAPAAPPAGNGGGAYVIRDLGSINGTWLNGQRLMAPERLRDGDVIEIAGARFTFRDPDATLETSHFPRLVVDEVSGEVWVDRCPVHLSQKQRALFMLLWHRRGHACTKDEIARAVWPECKGEIYDYQIESLVKRLRAKLEPRPEDPVVLLTVAGCGYRLVT